MNINNSYISVSLGIWLAMTTAVVQAGDQLPKPVTSPAQFGELDELRAQNAILTLKLANKELQDKIGVNNDAGKQVFKVSQSSSGPSITTALPKIQMISGVREKMSATLQLSDGRHVIVSVGSVVQNAGTVRKINKDEVILAQKGQLVSLPFVLETGQASAPSPASTMPPLPPELMSGGGK
jgi:type IV pilus biogenesis protein PilP